MSNAWITANFEQSQKALNEGDRDQALRYLGYAMHTLQDSTSPAHHGFQNWGIKDSQNSFTHVLDETFDPGAGSNMYKATQDAYDWFFINHKLPAGDLFRFYGADPRPAPQPQLG